MPVITARNFATGTQQFLSMGPEDYLRTLSIGTGWNRIRIGILYALSTVSENAWPIRNCSLCLGVCNGIQSTPAVISPAHAFGWGLPTYPAAVAANNWAYNAGTGGNSYFSQTAWSFFRYAAGVVTGAAVGALTVTTPSNTTLGGASARRGILILDINKSALIVGNITQGAMCTAVAHMTLDMASADLYAALASPAGATIQGTAMSTLALGNSLAFSETTNGPLDTVFLFWSHFTVPLQLYEIAVYRLG